MKVGTKSVLYGAHQFILHPLVLAVAWWRLYGFPWDPRLWVAFFVHDLGYVGKPNMDGKEGESHVLFGASVMAYLFGEKWGRLCEDHSRFWAGKEGRPISRLGVADKLAIALLPWWIYLPMVRASGELVEYLEHAASGKYSKEVGKPKSARGWYEDLQQFMREWVAKNWEYNRYYWGPFPCKGDRVRDLSFVRRENKEDRTDREARYASGELSAIGDRVFSGSVNIGIEYHVIDRAGTASDRRLHVQPRLHIEEEISKWVDVTDFKLICRNFGERKDKHDEHED